MAVRKYLFFIDDRGIRAYRFLANGSFEIIRHMGEDIYTEKKLEPYFQWFDKVASIAPNDNIDFCFLSTSKIDQPSLVYPYGEKSSWTKDELVSFCEHECANRNYEIHYGDNNVIVHQVSNIRDKNSIDQLHLKCIPDFSIREEHNQKSTATTQTSILYQYYREKLSEL